VNRTDGGVPGSTPPSNFSAEPSPHPADPLAMQIEDVLDGRYRIEERVTETDTGVVYRAKDLHDSVEVAVKVVPPALLGNGATLARYRHEVRIASELRHCNLVPVLRVGEAAGTHYTVMPLVVGSTGARLRAGAVVAGPG
jgi:serine/threonine protein kinase